MADDSVLSSFQMVGDTDLAVLLDLLPDTVLLLDAEGRVRWGNQAAERLFGRKREDSVGISALEFIHHDDFELALQSLATVQEKDVGTLIEVRVATPGGWRLVEVIGRAVPRPNDRSILFCIRDVTDRRRFEVARDDVAKFRSILQNAALVTMLVSTKGIIESASVALSRLFGLDPETVEGRPLVELLAPEDRPAVERAFETASRQSRSPGPVTVEAGIRRRANTATVPVALTIVSLVEDPTVGGFVVSLQDVSERALAERQLRKALSILRATLESTADGILVVDNQGTIISHNQHFIDLWEIPQDIVSSRDGARVWSLMAEQLSDPHVFLARLDEVGWAPEAETSDILGCRDERVLECDSKPQRLGKEVHGRVWSFRDVTERKVSEEALAYRATHDHLTGLANKEAFVQRLQRVVAHSEHTHRAALLFVDVDGLKLVNDRLGHLAGDRLLIEVAEILRSTTRAYDVVGRLGGDEFGVLVEDLASPDDVLVLVKRILAGVPSQFTDGDGSVEISVSVGISFTEPGRSHLEMLRQADLAMYFAKQQGGGRWELSSG